MSSLKMHVPRTTWLTAGALALLATGFLAAPARAADQDYKGWFGAIDLATTQPNSLDQHFGNVLDLSGTPVKQERLTIDNSADFTYRVSVGYAFGKSLGSLKVSYWNFDNDDEMSGNVPNGGIYPTLFGYGYYGGMYINTLNGYPVTFTATSKTKASTIDVDYTRPIASGDKVSMSWLAGLRVASYEEDLGFDGSGGFYGSTYTQAKHFKSNGAGLRVGALANFGFTQHFSLASSMVFSFLQADTEGDSSQLIGFTGQSETNSAKDDNIRGEIRDFDVKAVWSYGPLDYSVGYMMSNWDGMPADPLPANEGGFFAIGSTSPRGRDSVSFNSWHAGVRWRFGGKK